MMDEYVTVFRNHEGSCEALETIWKCRKRYEKDAVANVSRTFNTDLVHTIETCNLIDIAETITLFASKEFHGAHWRQEHQERKDGEWSKHTLITCSNGSPKLYFINVPLAGDIQT